jgi:hypothetical protein
MVQNGLLMDIKAEAGEEKEQKAVLSRRVLDLEDRLNAVCSKRDDLEKERDRLQELILANEAEHAESHSG